MRLNFFKKYEKRNSAVEILRMAFMAGIVFLHAYYHGSDGNIEWIYNLANSESTSYQLLLYSLSRLGVTGFMFISGYYGINMNATRLYKLFSMLVFYYVATELAVHNGINGGIFKGVFHVWDSWWFIASYFIIFIMSPAINEGLSSLTKRQFQYIVVGIIAYTYVGHFIIGKDGHDTDLLLSIYIIARYMRLYPPRKIQILQLLCLISTGMLAFLPVFIMKITGNVKLTDMIICNNSPIVLISAASMVVLADRYKLYCSYVNWLASSTLAIYLITESAFRIDIDKWLFNNILEKPYWGFCQVILVCLACLLADKIRLLLVKPLDKRITRWISGKY